ncbi:unnamed protein product [marine sediment metagenome]|uniref:Uncharacterized protein n=1 Tax=marine sediment metagenome TaxID=412755 RepID=X1T5L2_9ZZZZ
MQNLDDLEFSSPDDTYFPDNSADTHAGLDLMVMEPSEEEGPSEEELEEIKAKTQDETEANAKENTPEDEQELLQALFQKIDPSGQLTKDVGKLTGAEQKQAYEWTTANFSECTGFSQLAVQEQPNTTFSTTSIAPENEISSNLGSIVRSKLDYFSDLSEARNKAKERAKKKRIPTTRFKDYLNVSRAYRRDVGVAKRTYERKLGRFKNFNLYGHGVFHWKRISAIVKASKKYSAMYAEAEASRNAELNSIKESRKNKLISKKEKNQLYGKVRNSFKDNMTDLYIDLFGFPELITDLRVKKMEKARQSIDYVIAGAEREYSKFKGYCEHEV